MSCELPELLKHSKPHISSDSIRSRSLGNVRASICAQRITEEIFQTTHSESKVLVSELCPRCKSSKQVIKDCMLHLWAYLEQGILSSFVMSFSRKTSSDHDVLAISCGWSGTRKERRQVKCRAKSIALVALGFSRKTPWGKIVLLPREG